MGARREQKQRKDRKPAAPPPSSGAPGASWTLLGGAAAVVVAAAAVGGALGYAAAGRGVEGHSAGGGGGASEGPGGGGAAGGGAGSGAGECAAGELLRDGAPQSGACDSKEAEFVEWVHSAYRRKAMRVNSPPWGPVSIARFPMPGGGELRGLRAEADAKPSDALLMIPSEACIMVEGSRKHPALKKLKKQRPKLFKLLTDKQVQALRLCFEAGQGAKGWLAKWIRVLPHAIPTKPQWWDPRLRAELGAGWPSFPTMLDRWASSHKQPLEGLRAFLQDHAAELAGAADFNPSWADPVELWHWATGILDSRSFEKGMMVPLVDMANHEMGRPTLNKVILGSPPSDPSIPPPPPGYWAIWSDRKVAKGEQIFISYSDPEADGQRFSCDLDRLASFGFAFGDGKVFLCSELRMPVPEDLEPWRREYLHAMTGSTEGTVPIMIGIKNDQLMQQDSAMKVALLLRSEWDQRRIHAALESRGQLPEMDAASAAWLLAFLEEARSARERMMADEPWQQRVAAAPAGADMLSSLRTVTGGELAVLGRLIAALRPTAARLAASGG
eukprot:TRINITY_DN4878_c1_g1_i1.p1 TRINITY_DN4878_c1_g1~~TRINITY_DN4878_c1_g1_i1.p1  ORF type:complete len:556 (+),score=182.67 TRINITY_DN4878_c1_g1_i1:72-1739(+)